MKKSYVYIWIKLDKKIMENELEFRNVFVAAALKVEKATKVYVSASDISRGDCIKVEANAIHKDVSQKAWRDAVIKVAKILLKKYGIPSLKIFFAKPPVKFPKNGWFDEVIQNVEDISA